MSQQEARRRELLRLLRYRQGRQTTGISRISDGGEKKIRTIGNLVKGPIRFKSLVIINGRQIRAEEVEYKKVCEKEKEKETVGKKGTEEERGKTSRGEKRLSSAGFRCARKRGYPGLNEWRRKSRADVREATVVEREKEAEREKEREG
ncbi:hypothetical protein ALC57_12916 [Trachymyrmex cornetzi]|uniref:Uncharacterized protein n=1 Tax=Trachymyrmex cornetzi TaxID=471704 RepID=A0A195DPS0_9HYME|nr:hypothetical protein ALC57_12916 [Trachymyrmex cornetzi]